MGCCPSREQDKTFRRPSLNSKLAMLYHAKLIPWRLSWLERLQYGQTETGNEDSRALCFRKQYTVLQLFAQHAIWFLYIQEERPIVCYIAGYMIQKTHSRKKLRRQYFEIQICRCNNRETYKRSPKKAIKCGIKGYTNDTVQSLSTYSDHI